MSLLLSCITHGLTSTLQRTDVPDITYSRREVDRVQDAWRMPAADTLKEGDPHPVLTGCIIDELRVRGPFGEAGRQIWEADATSLGDARGTKPTKILHRGKSRTLESGWDQRGVRYLSWHADWKPCTGIASTGFILCDAHAFPNGKRVYFARKTGGSGITAQSSSSLGVGYYVVDRETNQFKVSLTESGAPVALGTDITACEVIAAEFALGAPHPDFSTLFLCELSVEDENTDWKIATAMYRGLEEDKPYHRLITVNGQQFSSSSPITISLPSGWEDPRHTNFHLPEVVVTDTYLVGSGTLPTSSVPSFSTPDNAPSIPSIVLTDDTDDLTWNYPYGWTLIAAPHAATLNSQISAMVYSKVYRYIWPVMFR